MSAQKEANGDARASKERKKKKGFYHGSGLRSNRYFPNAWFRSELVSAPRVDHRNNLPLQEAERAPRRGRSGFRHRVSRTAARCDVDQTMVEAAGSCECCRSSLASRIRSRGIQISLILRGWAAACVWAEAHSHSNCRNETDRIRVDKLRSGLAYAILAAPRSLTLHLALRV